MTRVAVIGGGISGLSSAWFARELGHQVTVFEQAEQCGGYLSSREEHGIALEFGATTLRIENQATLALLDALDLQNSLVEIPVRKLPKFIVTGSGPRQLRRVGPPSVLREFASVGRLASHATGLRRRPAADTDLQTYVQQIAGRKAAPLARALARGLVGAHAENLSARFVLGHQRYTAMAQQRRLLRALRAAPGTVSPVRSVWIRGGNQRLASAIAATLPDLRTGLAATLAITPQGLTVQGEVFDRVILATAVGAATDLLAAALPQLEGQLAAVRDLVPAGRIAAHTMRWNTPTERLLASSPLHGAFGVLNGDKDNSHWFGLQFASHMVPERAPHDQTIATLVVPDADRAASQTKEACRLLQLPEPDLVIQAPVQAFLPHPRPGYQSAVEQLQDLCRPSGILLAGNWLFGAGVPKCIAQAHSLAVQL